MQTAVLNVHSLQITKGTAAMHAAGYMHRDIKPENVLMRGPTVKLADLGQARQHHGIAAYTATVATLWYGRFRRNPLRIAVDTSARLTGTAVVSVAPRSCYHRDRADQGTKPLSCSWPCRMALLSMSGPSDAS